MKKGVFESASYIGTSSVSKSPSGRSILNNSALKTAKRWGKGYGYYRNVKSPFHLLPSNSKSKYVSNNIIHKHILLRYFLNLVNSTIIYHNFIGI